MRAFRFYPAGRVQEVRYHGKPVGTVRRVGHRWAARTPDGRDLPPFPHTRRAAARALCAAVALSGFFEVAP